MSERNFFEHINYFKLFVEGDISIYDWQTWFDRYAPQLFSNIKRLDYLCLKFYPLEHLCKILEKYGISYKKRERCSKCSDVLFRAIPGITIKEEIMTFAQNAKFKGAEKIAQEAWMHPGMHYPNCGFTIFHSYKID
ncbi:MAG: hypothetical protein V7K92_10790 [Nostoc sp.]|uniref:hypothetical protein n=1 Tax=Nostoc sp. TaxID=1180 RepID=UPI002FEE9AEF